MFKSNFSIFGKMIEQDYNKFHGSIDDSVALG